MKSKILSQQVTHLETGSLTTIQKLVCWIFKIPPVKEYFISAVIEVDNNFVAKGHCVMTDLGFKFYVTSCRQRKITMTSTKEYNIFTNNICNYIIPITNVYRET